MGTIWLKDFKGGLDTRRMPETLPGGSLILGRDGHVNRGGEFEQRAAFVEEYELPDGTVGLGNDRAGLYVFGSDAAPTMPRGVTYQRLQHPDATTPIFRILSVELFAGKVYVIAEFNDGTIHHFENGTRVTDWQDGRARFSFQVTGGTAASKLTDLTINSVSIIGEAVDWTTSHAATAEAIAAAINNFGSTPDYTATVVGDRVNILAVDPGTTPNGYNVVMSVASGLTLTPGSGTLTNGLAPGSVFQSGTFAKTNGSKMYVASGPNLHFSGILEPREFQSSHTGAGFIDMSTEAAGSEALTAIAKYLQYIAVFAGRVTQIWYVDPDPDLNKQQQVLNNMGTLSPRSVTQFGDNDLFFLDESGIRSLKARDSSNAAATTDIGIPVDTLVVEKLKALTPLQRSQVVGLIEPSAGRFWMVFPDEIFVFSFFEGSNISSWSTYTPAVNNVPFTINEAIVFKKKVYLRSGNKIYVYGGLGETVVYDSTSPVAWTPFLDAGAPAKKKQFNSIDVACEGTWIVRAGMSPRNIEASDKIATVDGTTYEQERVPFEAEATHVSLRFEGVGAGAKKIAAAAIHFTGDEADDG